MFLPIDGCSIIFAIMPVKPLSESRKARVLAKVKALALLPDGQTFKLGALSRIAEYLECSRTTVRKSLLNEDGWKFSEKRFAMLDAMITEGFDLSAKKSGPQTDDASKIVLAN